VYTPAETERAEQDLAAQYDGPKFTGPLALFVEYHKDRQSVCIRELPPEDKAIAQADIDNLVKLTMDALNGVAWNDDRQIVRLEAVKLH
jgi:Holliday junction resolvase RusA-like endonuclease